ncbi:twin-arginine translocase TatA/TatE family subunit [Thermochromatium tepidum]|jgi:twin arginine-targeting protein translocase, TatA/E family|uniref:Sec-independent protein translocase protein TatA n=1 Tax=Thermochromatium tepidum ATCC 43061 TaxID=316276 RepID=A0A6I6E0E6_THETI|nr:twin-arginine translocase TatA/TatE family subunit [Thermochromatium tepidum]QGU33344.1 twin-arginine translocase TatA/TatE family subunit [Thermochromatium tepidum ATCC 43061]
MGVSGISIWQLLIILVIVVLLFGTKRLKNIGSDLGEAIRGFRRSMAGSDNDDGNGVRESAAITQPGGARPTDSSTQSRPAETSANRDRA